MNRCWCELAQQTPYCTVSGTVVERCVEPEVAVIVIPSRMLTLLWVFLSFITIASSWLLNANAVEQSSSMSATR